MRKAGAWILEKIARLKFPSVDKDENGFGVFEALEGLALGIHGKHALWRSLSASGVSIRFPFDYAHLEKRAVEQFEQVQAKCLELAPSVLRAGTE